MPALKRDSRYSDNIVENAYVDELANFFAVLRGEEAPRWSFEKDLAAIDLMDRVQAAGGTVRRARMAAQRLDPEQWPRGKSTAFSQGCRTPSTWSLSSWT